MKLTNGQRVTSKIASQDRRDANARAWQLRGPAAKIARRVASTPTCEDCNGTGRNPANGGAPCFCPAGDVASVATGKGE